MKKLFLILLVMVMLFSSAPAFAASSDIGVSNIIIDTVLLRPLGIVSTAFGGAFFVVSLPISAITSSVGTTFDLLVKDPFQYTFRRPLGQIKKSD